MTATIKELINLARRYDRFTCYIDSYRQMQEAEACNAKIEAEFIETAAKLGVNVSGMEFANIVDNTGTVYSKFTVEEAVEQLLQEKGYYNKEDKTMVQVEVNNNNKGAIKRIMATCCNLAQDNYMKNYISDFMLESCINKELHGKWSKENKQVTEFTAEQKTATQDMKSYLLNGAYLIPYKNSGYTIKAEWIVWFYDKIMNGKQVIYRHRQDNKCTDFRVNRADNTVTNVNANITVQLNDKAWKQLNALYLHKIV